MSNRNRHKTKNNPKPINANSYSPTSLGGRINAELLCKLYNQNKITDGTNDKKSLQTERKEE